MLVFYQNKKRGIAIIMVLAILSTLLIVSVPFAIALRSEKRATKISLLQTQMNIEADGIQDYAVGQLAKDSSVNLKDITKDLEKNKTWSVHIEDELGKININTVDPFTLGNVIASAIIQKDVGSTDNVIIVDSTNRFPARGTLWIHGEVISYQNITPTSFLGCSRNLAQSSQVMHKSLYTKGTQVIDIRAYNICKHRIQKDTYVPYANIEEIKKVPGVDDDLFTRIKPFLTVYSNSHARWIHDQPISVKEELTDSSNIPSFTITTNYQRTYNIHVEDTRFFKVGMTVRLRHLKTILDAIILKIDQHLLTIDSNINFDTKDELGTSIHLLETHPVNINVAPPFTLYSLLKGQKIKYLKGNSIYETFISSKCASILSSAITGYTQSGGKFTHVKEIFEFFKKLKKDLKNARELDEEGNILLQEENECLAIALLLGGSGNNIPLVCYDTQRVYTIESTALQYKNNIPEASQSVCTITTVAPICKQQWGLSTYQDFIHNQRILPSQHIAILPKEVDIVQELLPKDSLSMGISVASTRIFPKNHEPSYTYYPYDDTEQGIVYPGESPDVSFHKDTGQEIEPGTLSFWFYPYSTSDQTIVSLTTDDWENNLVLKYENGAWLLQLSDATLEHIVSEIRHNAMLQQTWYYICIAWYTTNLGGLALWIDNKPVGQSGFQKEKFFSSMKLKASLSETDKTISLTNASILPAEGAIKIGSEIIEYDSCRNTTLHVREKYPDYPKTDVVQRGARGTLAQKHPDGALVSLVGYKTKLVSNDLDTPCLFPASKLKSAIVAKAIYTKHENGTSILKEDKKISVDSTKDFANKGVIFIAGIDEESNESPQKAKGEFIYYKAKDRKNFLNCSRGFYNSQPHKYTKAYIIPLSIYVEDNKKYADPEKETDCYVQIDEEWIKYEKKEDNDLLVYRTEIQGLNIDDIYQKIMNGSINLVDLYSRYRGVGNTPKQDHKDGTLVLPVFRVAPSKVGPFDEITLVDSSEQKESNEVKWSKGGYVALKEDVKNEYKSQDLFLKFPTGDLPKINITKFQWGNNRNSFMIDEVRYMQLSNYPLSTQKILKKNDKTIALNITPQENQLYKIGDEYFTCLGQNRKNISVRDLLNSGSQNYSKDTDVYPASFIPITTLSDIIDDKLDEIPVYDINGFPSEGYLYCNGEIIGYTGAEYNYKTKNYQFYMPYTQDVVSKKHIEGLLRGRYGTTAQRHGKNSVVFPFVTRYYDRYMPHFRGPACAYLYMAKTVPGAFWKSIEWIEPVNASKLGVHVYIFINQHKCLDFHSPAKKYDINVAGDTLEVFVWFPYQDNAYLNGQWKTRTVVKDLKVEYYQTTNVWQKKRYCLQ